MRVALVVRDVANQDKSVGKAKVAAAQREDDPAVA
jgi:hypothetical protein